LLECLTFDHASAPLLDYDVTVGTFPAAYIDRVFSLNSTGWLDINCSVVQGTDIVIDRSAVLNCTGDAVVLTGQLGRLTSNETFYAVTGGYAFNLGTTVLFFTGITNNSVFINDASAGFLSGTTGSANITAGELGNVQNTQINNTGGGTILNGIVQSDTRWRFFNNNQIKDTRPDALASFSGGAATTTIVTTGVPVKVNATWTAADSNQFTIAADGRLTFIGEVDATLPIDMRITGTMASGGEKTMEAYVAINGAAVSGSAVPFFPTSSKADTAIIIWQHTFTNGDYVEAFVANNSDTVDFVAESGTERVN
jgi:hypothetical protein